jgi:hypothetical protein
MNDLDSRLSAWNPVRTENVIDAAASAEAAGLLQRVLSQPIASPSRRRSSQPGWRAQAWIAASAAIAVVAAGIAAAVLSAPRQTGTPKVASGPVVVGFQRGPSQGVATNAVQLVDYATRAAALAPVFVPDPRDWMYLDVLDKGPYSGPHGYHDTSWQQIGFDRVATLDHGKLSYGYGGGPGAQLQGWPGNVTNLYRYLATLPSEPAALRRTILANNHSQPAAAFNAMLGLMNDFPLPPRFQAELYAVLVGLPGVHFDRSATDAARRQGVGLYVIQDGFLKTEIIINARTYAYMGLLWMAVKAHTEYGTSPAVLHLHKGSIEGWNAIVGSGIVSRAGQLPQASTAD